VKKGGKKGHKKREKAGSRGAKALAKKKKKKGWKVQSCDAAEQVGSCLGNEGKTWIQGRGT